MNLLNKLKSITQRVTHYLAEVDEPGLSSDVSGKPVLIAGRIDYQALLTMLKHQAESTIVPIRGKCWVASYYVIRLSSTDMEAFSSIGDLRQEFLEGLKADISEHFKQKGYATKRTLSVTLQRDDTLGAGKHGVESFFETAPETVQEARPVRPNDLEIAPYTVLQRIPQTMIKTKALAAVPTLTVVSGNLTQKTFPLVQEKMTIGRVASENQADIVVEDKAGEISRHHARIEQREGKYYLIDTSTNGTSINQVTLVRQQPYALEDGDRVTLAGNVEMLYQSRS
jgi:hypothetical protein